MQRETIDHAGELRRALAVAATQYAQGRSIPYYVSRGTPPTVLFHPHGENRHGSFLPATYRKILATPDWNRRLEKAHSQRSALPAERQDMARELDSSTSSDALLMNLFCHPASTDAPLLAALFGLTTLPTPAFGVKAKVPLKGQGEDQTELDMQLGPVNVESKLTESDFTEADLAKVLTYQDAESVFDLDHLKAPGGRVSHYQLLRNVLAIRSCSERRFVLLADSRRPDLLAAWQEVMEAIREESLRQRCRVITWQEAAFCAPRAVREFLREKYAIEPAAPQGIASQAGGFDVDMANQALRTLYEIPIGALFAELKGIPGVSNPLLVEAPAEYAQSKTRLMVVGQQTFGYEGDLGAGLGEDPVAHLLGVYREFDLGGGHRSSPFWQAAHALHDLLNPQGPMGGFLWSNLIKVDQGNYRPEPDVEVASRRLFNVLPGEVAILQPDVIVFFTGPGYDGALCRVFNGAKLEACGGHEVEDLARVEHPGLPVRTYRTHHPHTLRMQKQWDLLDAIAQAAGRTTGAEG